MNKPLRYLILALWAAPLWAQTQPSSGFEQLGRYRGWGGMVASTVAPGREPGSERLYASFLYNENTIDVIAVNPATGAADVYHSPIQGDFGARNIAVGPDGNVYLGTLPHAHFLKLDRRAGKLIDLGQPSGGEQYIWDVTFGPDKKLYGATYPGCKLVRYDPVSGKLDDLGKLDPTEQYARWIVSGKDGFVYVGIGTSKANIAAYDVRKGTHQEILPADAVIVGTAKVYLDVDGDVYGTVGKRTFRLEHGRATEIPGAPPAAMNPNTLHDGRVVKITEAMNTVTVTDSRTPLDPISHKVSYDGNDLALFRIAFGPDGGLYGSAILPIHFVQVDPKRRQIDRLTNLGGGEIYSMLNTHGRLWMGAYSGTTPLMSYKPGSALHPSKEADGNPTLLTLPGVDASWRPQAMVEGPDNHIYIGAVPGYGELAGPLDEWLPDRGTLIRNQDIVKDQNTASLAVWHEFLVGGTTIYGGGGSHPTQKESQLYLWSTATHRVEFSMVPVTGAESITDLIAAPNGLIYGIAGNQRTAMLQQEGPQHSTLSLFVFDPATRKIVATRPLPFSNAIYNSVGVNDGKIWGLAEDGIFRIDPTTYDSTLVAHPPEKITGGFDMRDGFLYFVSGPAVYRYRMEAGAH